MCNGHSARQSGGGTIAVLSPLAENWVNENFEGDLYFHNAERRDFRTRAIFQGKNGCNGEALSGCVVVIQYVIQSRVSRPHD